MLTPCHVSHTESSVYDAVQTFNEELAGPLEESVTDEEQPYEDIRPASGYPRDRGRTGGRGDRSIVKNGR